MEILKEFNYSLLFIIIALGMIGAFANALSVSNFKNGFHVVRIILSVCFVSPTVYLLLDGLVDYKFQALLTILSGAFHEDSFILLHRRFYKSGEIISNENEIDKRPKNHEHTDKH